MSNILHDAQQARHGQLVISQRIQRIRSDILRNVEARTINMSIENRVKKFNWKQKQNIEIITITLIAYDTIDRFVSPNYKSILN